MKRFLATLSAGVFASMTFNAIAKDLETGKALPSLMGDVELSAIVAGKKDSSTPGNGTDTNNDGTNNYVYKYTNTDGKVKYLDYDSGGGGTKTWSCYSYGYFSGGSYIEMGGC